MKSDVLALASYTGRAKISAQPVGVFLLELFDQIVPHQKVIEPVSHEGAVARLNNRRSGVIGLFVVQYAAPLCFIAPTL